MADWDIYDWPTKIGQIKRQLGRLEIPAENKKLIEAFEEACIVQGMGVPRRAKVLRHLKDIAVEFLPTPFAEATIADLQKAVARVETREGYSPYTKRDVKIVLRQFFKWLVFRENWGTRREFPDLVAWIRTEVRRKDTHVVRASELITPEEVDRLIESAPHPRNRAFLALLYEVGARIGEAGALRVGDVAQDERGLLVDLDGKTGKRTVRLVQLAGHVVTWLNLHPARNNPAAPLWPSHRKGGMHPLPYRELFLIVQKAARAAGLRKRIYPHLFRHSRATHLLASGALNEAQAKVYFGWVPDSRILSTYIHLVAKDANDAILRMHGLAAPDPGPAASGLTCGMCKTPNPAQAALCYRCGCFLAAAPPAERAERVSAAGGRLAQMLDTPEGESAFRRLLREELAALFGATPPPRSPRPAGPTPGGAPAPSLPRQRPRLRAAPAPSATTAATR
jgi:integrase